jgi:hypothetical protein
LTPSFQHSLSPSICSGLTLIWTSKLLYYFYGWLLCCILNWSIDCSNQINFWCYFTINIRCVVVNRKNHKWVFLATFTIEKILVACCCNKHSLCWCE